MTKTARFYCSRIDRQSLDWRRLQRMPVVRRRVLCQVSSSCRYLRNPQRSWRSVKRSSPYHSSVKTTLQFLWVRDQPKNHWTLYNVFETFLWIKKHIVNNLYIFRDHYSAPAISSGIFKKLMLSMYIKLSTKTWILILL